MSFRLLPRTTTARCDDTRCARLSKANAEGGAKSFPFPCSCPRVFCRRADIPLVARAGIVRGFAVGPMRPRNSAHESANTPLVQLHAMAVHNAKQNRIRGKEDKGGETKKNLPSLTRRSVVERQRTEGDNGVFEGDNTPYSGSAVALSERGLHNANTPLVQLHAMTAHNAKHNRIRGKEDNGAK